MATETLVFEQLLKVVRHSNEIELDCTTIEVDSGRMYISKDKALLVDVLDCFAELPEDGYGLLKGERPLAEGFPGADVVWCLTWELQETILHMAIEVEQLLSYIEQVSMAEVLDLLRETLGKLLLVSPESWEIDKGH